MSPDLASWFGSLPLIPLAVVAGLGVLFLVSSRNGKKKQETLATTLAAGAHVIDVRSKAEFAGGHYPGAINHPVETLQNQLKKLGSPERPLVVYCASGGRSARAAALLRNAGFTNVTDAGGLSNLPR